MICLGSCRRWSAAKQLMHRFSHVWLYRVCNWDKSEDMLWCFSGKRSMNFAVSEKWDGCKSKLENRMWLKDLLKIYGVTAWWMVMMCCRGCCFTTLADNHLNILELCLSNIRNEQNHWNHFTLQGYFSVTWEKHRRHHKRVFSRIYYNYFLYYDYHINLRDSPSRILWSYKLTQIHSSPATFWGAYDFSTLQYVFQRFESCDKNTSAYLSSLVAA